MLRPRYLALPAAAVVLTLATAAPTSAQSNSKEILALEPAGLVEILQNTDAPVFEKAKACQRLAVVGTKEAIPALVALLSDEALNHYARFGLEGIPDPAVDDALRDAATQLQGRQLVGVIDSIGQRKDARAVELLKGFLGGFEPAIASAAAGALGRIGTPKAAGALREALAVDSPVNTSIGDACLACAEGLAATGKRAAALDLYEAVAKSNLPTHLQVGALDGQFRLLATEGKDLLVAQIRSEDEAFFYLGLAVAREMPGADVTAALAGQLEKLPDQRQALLLRALGDRRDRPPLASALAASQSESPLVREAAVYVLAKLGDPSAVVVLLDAALGDGEVAQVAREGLKTPESPEVDEAIAARLAGADAKTKVILFELVGARRIAAAEPEVREALANADLEVRLAAITALGQLVELVDFDLLVSRALGDAASLETAAAQAALTTAALRMGDREACAGTLAIYMVGASATHQVYLLELLGKVSGQTALEAMVASAKYGDPALKDAATRVLGDWINADAAPALLDIAKNDEDSKYQIRALRGYIRIARQFQLPDKARLAMFRTAMEVAQRVEEKQLALDILSRIPSAATLALAVSWLDQPDLKDAAADAAVKIAGKLVDRQPKPVAKAMQKVVDAGLGGDLGNRAQQLLEQAKAGSK